MATRAVVIVAWMKERRPQNHVGYHNLELCGSKDFWEGVLRAAEYISSRNSASHPSTHAPGNFPKFFQQPNHAPH
jgi:hypothetical protein